MLSSETQNLIQLLLAEVRIIACTFVCNYAVESSNKIKSELPVTPTASLQNNLLLAGLTISHPFKSDF